MFNYDTDLSNNTYDEAVRIINPYEFIYSKVPGSKYSVSKLKHKSHLFYDLFEILNNFNLFDNAKISIKSLHISHNFEDSINSYEMFREGYSDEIVFYDSINIDDSILGEEFEYIYFETNMSNNRDYIISMINILIVLMKSQKFEGNLIIKMGDVSHKPVIDCLYLLTSLYDKVYMVKPNTNNITTLDRYIICKSFLYNETTRKYLRLNMIKLIILLKKLDNKYINYLLDFDVPYYFKNKLDDLNIIIGQQKLELIYQNINILKSNKNKIEKINIIKKNNISKCLKWFIKNKIPIFDGCNSSALL
jgi:hypothetical protein